jgi:hypothetical protein
MKTIKDIKVGDKLASSTGYDASITEGHIVTAVKGKTIEIRKVEHSRKYTAAGGMEFETTLHWDKPTGLPMKKTPKFTNNDYLVKINDYRIAFPTTSSTFNDYNYH